MSKELIHFLYLGLNDYQFHYQASHMASDSHAIYLLHILQTSFLPSTHEAAISSFLTHLNCHMGCFVILSTSL